MRRFLCLYSSELSKIITFQMKCKL
jgi:hypothetical protein